MKWPKPAERRARASRVANSFLRDLLDPVEVRERSAMMWRDGYESAMRDVRKARRTR